MNTVKFTYKDGKNKALTMSYDDGIVQDKRLIEIFNKHGIKGSFHINGGLFGAVHKHPRLFAEDIRTVYEGHEVSCHGYTHPFLEKLAPMEVVHEILDDKKALEDACGYVVRGMSYPYGTYSEDVISIISKLGINYARTTVSTGKFAIPEDFMRWHATCHHNDKNLMKHLENLKNAPAQRDLQLMYVWGHAYEFDDNDNWNVIEEFCEKAGGDPDIWYATNIEIFDYVTAMRKCELSADRTMLYNPSATSVWVKAGGKTIECKGGVTTKLD